MNLFSRLFGKHRGLSQPSSGHRESSGQNESKEPAARGMAPVGQETEVVQMLKRMASEKPDLANSFDLDKLHESVAISERHAQMIRKLGPSITGDLTAALTETNPKVREQACWALQILGSASSLPDETIVAVAARCTEGEAKVREQAVFSLAALAPARRLGAAMPQLLAALRNPDKKTRKGVVEVLGKMGQDAAPALAALRPMLNDSDVDVAEAAKAAITKLGGAIEQPAHGSSDDVQRLARLTSSSDYDAPKKAWAEIEKLADPAVAIGPLMTVFRSVGKPTTDLCKFLAKVGTEACRAPLLEILDHVMKSSDPWTQKHLLGSACVALLKLPGGVAALGVGLPPERTRFILMRGLMYADDRDRPGIVA